MASPNACPTEGEFKIETLLKLLDLCPFAVKVFYYFSKYKNGMHISYIPFLFESTYSDDLMPLGSPVQVLLARLFSHIFYCTFQRVPRSRPTSACPCSTDGNSSKFQGEYCRLWNEFRTYCRKYRSQLRACIPGEFLFSLLPPKS